MSQHEGSARGGGPGGGGVPPRHVCCVQARDKIYDPAPRGVLEGGVREGFPPPARLLCPSTRPAAVSKHETGTVTKQTIGALQFMVSFALRGGGRLLHIREHISLRCALGGGRCVPEPAHLWPILKLLKQIKGIKRAGRDCQMGLRRRGRCYFAFEILLGTWLSACYQRVGVLSQLLDIDSAFQLLLGTWPSACYQRVDVLSQLLNRLLRVGLSCYYFAFELLLGT